MFNNSGDYELHISDVKSGFSYYTFTPRLLCDIDKVVEKDDELMILLSQAHRNLGFLNGIIKYMPVLDNYINLLNKKEAQNSCKIDGIDASFNDIIRNKRKDNENINEIQRYIEAFDISIEKSISNKLLCELHEIIICKNQSNTIGSFRNAQIFIEPHVFTNMKDYNPTAPEDLKNVLTDFEKFIKRDDNIDALIKTALIHYQFEIIHPFDKGNGRIGRILMIFNLMKYKILLRPILPLSKYLLLFKSEYFDKLRNAQVMGEYAPWIKFFLRTLIYATEDSINHIDAFLLMRKKNIELINTLGKSSKNVLLVFEYIEQNPIVNVSELSDKLNLSFNTVGSAVEMLVKFDILRQTSEQLRHRSFVYTGLLDLVNNENENKILIK